MIFADHWRDNGDGTAWVVFNPCDLPPDRFHDGGNWCQHGWKALDRPCDTCGGTEEDPTTAVGIDPCPANCIDGRHTFTVEVENPHCASNWPEHEVDGYDPHCCRFPKSCSAFPITHRVSVVPGMVLPIQGDDFTAIHGKWVLIYDDDDPPAVYDYRTHIENITLPHAAAPGMWAVKLAIH